MSAQISTLTAQVMNLAQQVASYHSNTTKPTASSVIKTNNPTNNSPKATPKLQLSLQKKPVLPGPENTTSPSVPVSSTYAGVAKTTDNTTEFNLVSRKKVPKKPAQLLKPHYDPNDQKVIIQLHPSTPPQSTVQITWQYLQLANKAVREYQKDLDFYFVRCHVTQIQNFVLQTSPKTRGTDYFPYLDAIKARIETEAKLQITSIDAEARWSKFLLHGVPISANMEEVASSIQQSYPGVLKLAQTPRWLSTTAKRQASGKGMSTVVLAIAGQHTLQSLGYQYLFVCNSRCRLDKYLPFGPSSQCGNCCRFGHPTTMCQEKKPTCGVCGKEHATRYHPCPAPDCHGGGRCTHTPIHCVNCNNNLHTSINFQCPTRKKVRQQKLTSGIITDFDTSVKLDPPVSTTNQSPLQS